MKVKGWIVLLIASLPLLLAATVQVSWNPNTESDMASYRVYEGTNLVGTVTHPTTTIDILNVADGTWIYFVTAVDQSGNESVRSTGASITFDSVPPGKPVGVGARIKK